MKKYILLIFFSITFFFSAGAQYCTPSYTGYGYDQPGVGHFAYATSFTHIANVQFGDINFTNLPPSWYNTIPQYIDQTGIPTIPTSCVRGFSYPLSIQVGNGVNTQTLSVWVDFNGNKIFEASEKIIFQTDVGSVGTHVITKNVTFPANAALGTIRMRCGTKYGINATLDPCVNNDPLTAGGGTNWSQQFVDFAINVVGPQPQIFQSTTTTQSVLDDVTKGSINNQVIGVEVVTNSGSLNPLTVGNINFSSIGTTNPNEITRARLFYTGFKPTFDTSAAVGGSITNVGSSFSINAAQQLLPGKNYFWLSYDISNNAVLDNKIDARCNFVTVGNVQRVPTVVSPLGNRQVGYCVSKGTQSLYVSVYSMRMHALNVFSGANASGYDNFTYLTDTITKSSTSLANDSVFIMLGNGVNDATYAAWIDFNHDGFFNDVTEMILKDTVQRAFPGQYLEKKSVFAIPMNAICGKTRMRISAQTGVFPSACTNPVIIGEVEDYSIVIKEVGQPVADFKSTTVCNGDSTQFLDLSYVFGTNTISNRLWDFGDAASGVNDTSTLQNPKHKFTTSGVYNVKLMVTASTSGSPTSTITRAVQVEKPVAQFSMSSTSNNIPIQFTDASTGGTMVQWAWNFGDPSSGVNNTSNFQNPVHTFFTAGVYNVRLIVTSSAGCKDTITTAVSIQLPTPIAGYTSTSFNPYVGANTSLIDVSVNNPTSWQWKFSPNTVTFQNGTNANSEKPVVTFDVGGTYAVKLIACNVSGCDSITKTFTTKNYIKPVASFSASPLFVRVGQIVSYLDQSTNDPTAWLWDFGDLTTSTTQYPQHSYNTADTFTVKLKISNPAGSDSTKITKYIIVTDGFTMCDNTAVSTNFKSGVIMDSGGGAGDYGDNEICGFLIKPNCSGVIKLKFRQLRMAANDFVKVYDGTNDTTGIPLFSGNGFTGATIPDTLFAYSGALFIRMQTNNASTDSGFNAQWIAIDNVKPKVNILMDTIGYVNSLSRYTNLTTGAGNQYLWDVNGDGINDSTTKDAAYRFTTIGTYKIRLIARNCIGSDTGVFTIKIVASTRVPQADFISNKLVIDLNDEIILTDLSQYGTTGWKWDVIQDATANAQGFVFSNGTKDTMVSPSVLFYEPGYYTICLTSKNNIGSSITYCKTAYIFVKDRVTMCNTITSSSIKQGKIFDSGDNIGNYANLENCDFLITVPCVNKIVMTFKSFNFSPGDYLRVYDGTDSISGIPLFNGLGFSSTNSPGTLTSYSGSFYILEKTNASLTAAGFEADWNSFDRDSTNTLLQLLANDTGYVNATHIFKNYSLPNSVYKFDFNADALFDTVSNASIFPYKYTSPGVYNAVMFDTVCGTTSATKEVVILPITQKPVANFDADIKNPATRDTVTLFDLSKNGALSYAWTITPATYTLVNSTLSDGLVRVTFNAVGTYSIGLTSTNSFGSDVITKTAFITAHILCSPTFTSGQTTTGIYRVQLGLMNNVTTQVYGYHDYSQIQIAQIERGSSGNFIAMERIASTNAQSWSIWLDANQDGQFSASELLGQAINSTASLVSGYVSIPSATLLGLTRIRFAAYFGSVAAIDGCSPMANGEVEDYSVMIIGDRTKPVITLLGNNPDSVEIGYNYIDPGATALDNVDGNISANIIKTGNLNTSVMGTYQLKYNGKDSSGNAADEKVRIVNVTKDKTPPTITLIGADTIYVEVHFTYTELGATATDLTDGNITSKIIIAGVVDTSAVGDYTIAYQVTDSAGNTRIKYRKVIVRDTQKPVITLIGSAIVKIIKDSAYTELGVTITDNYYKNLTPVITGTVLIHVLGKYFLLYDVTDGSGNKAATVQREVDVEPHTGISNLSLLQKFNVTPNPSNGLFILSLDFAVSQNVIIKITDINGKLIQEMNDNILSKQILLNLNNNASGIYLLSVSTSEGVLVKKLVKE
jgi:PKD repeat protein